MEPNRGDPDREQSRHTQPGIPRPGQQQDQQQDPNAPLQPDSRDQSRSSQWIPPRTGNPDLDPAGIDSQQRVDLRERNPLVPQGMLFDPRQMHPQYGATPPEGYYQPQNLPPPGARFDPYGPPDPDQVGPGRAPFPGSQFGVPDPDHFPPPGMQQQPRYPRPPFQSRPPFHPRPPRGGGLGGGGGGIGGGFGPF